MKMKFIKKFLLTSAIFLYASVWCNTFAKAFENLTICKSEKETTSYIELNRNKTYVPFSRYTNNSTLIKETANYTKIINSNDEPIKVSVFPAILEFNMPAKLTFIVKSTADTIRALKLIKPELFKWNSSLITTENKSAFVSSYKDTTFFMNFTLTANDSIIINIPNVTAVDSTDEFTVPFLSSTDGITFTPAKINPKILVCGSPKKISEIKIKNENGAHLYLGKWVVTEGVVTVANEFGGPSYLQDDNSGLAVYDSSITNNVKRGDKIIVVGKVSPFYNLFELNPATILKISERNIVYDTLTLSISQIKSQRQSTIEPYEARIVRINGIEKVMTTNNTSATIWSAAGSGTNYNLLSGNDTIEARINSKTNIVNRHIPFGKFDIIGVLSQFKDSYQLIPRSYEDIIESETAPKIISTIPYESNITASSITFCYKTDIPGTTIIKYGKTNKYETIISDTNKVTQHSLSINGLEPSTIYHVQLCSSINSDTTCTPDYITETSSLTSSGTINVYFNYNVDKSVSTGEDAQQVNIAEQFLRRINSTQHSIDIALYSLSGNVGSSIVNALKGAKNRGVKIRVIGEYDNRNTSSWNSLINSGIPVIFDNFDQTNNGAGLMHNKFAVFDNRDSLDTNDWVWTGSWNATDSGNNNDAQNVIEIQDESLANAYRLEFEEMWGSSTDIPNSANSRFGIRKTNNTPHVFNIAGARIELYFDPSDHTTSHIANAMNLSASSINIAMLTFTRSDLAQILVNKKNAGKKVHIVLDNNTDTGNQFYYLKNNGVDILLKGNAISGFLHHKYAIIDADISSADQIVVTGSHNWSNAAENSNNENTLIIHSKRIANLYFQEFKARYLEAGGTDIITDIKKNNDEIPSNFSLLQNYPNPFNPITIITYQLPVSSHVALKIYDLLGRDIATLVNEEKAPGVYKVKFDGSNLASGIYFYRIVIGSFTDTKKFVLLK
ncbi:phospholipase D-like domain-containing protein [Melioribacteraceae bacterium 4301-Me]|uniref:phospholipase D-like domain-containing protein n=1 Tax=Pyranulibacter aquaticus TaxID=3163344 RepID=UPI00359899A6